MGFTKEDNPVMRAWQVSGGSVSNEPVGWKLLRLDEATEAVVTQQRSLAPRPGYNPGDPVMMRPNKPETTRSVDLFRARLYLIIRRGFMNSKTHSLLGTEPHSMPAFSYRQCTSPAEQ